MKSATGLTLVAAITLATLVSTAISRAENYGPFKEVDTAIGKVLADAKGMTLYTYDKDEAGKSNCTGECAVIWPPVLASTSDKPADDVTIISRSDGSLQWAYDGNPLYTFAKDKAPGDVNGHDVKNVWHVIME